MTGYFTAALAGFILGASILDVSAEKASVHSDPKATDDFFTNQVVRVLKIEIPPAGTSSLRRDARTFVRASLREGPTVYTNVLVRLKGGAGSFRPLNDKPGLTLKMDEASGAFHGLKKFHLNNSVQDDTYLSEWLCSQLFREAGVPAPRALPVIVELNRRRLGMYVLLESVDPSFLARTFTNTHGNVYSPPGNTDITEPLDCIGGRETNNLAPVKALAAAARRPNAATLGRVLDVDRFLSYMAMEVMLCHWDGYTSNVKNYLLYHDVDTQRIVFIPHDLDQMIQDPTRPVVPRANGMVARAVLADPELRKRYLERFAQLYAKLLVPSALTARVDDAVKHLAPGIEAYDRGSGDAFVQNAAGLKARIVRRAQFLHTRGYGLVPFRPTRGYMREMMLSPNWEHLTSVAPSIKRAKS